MTGAADQRRNLHHSKIRRQAGRFTDTRLVDALVFPLSTIFSYTVDYSDAATNVRKRFCPSLVAAAGPAEIEDAASTLKLGETARSEIGSLLDQVEVSQAKSAILLPGAATGLKSASSKSLKLALVSELGVHSTELLLGRVPEARFSVVICRDRPVGPHSPEKDLSTAIHSMGVQPSGALLFCNSLAQIRAARDVGAEPVVLPTKGHDVNTLLAAGPSRMLMSLAEIEDMLAFLPS